MALKPIYKKDKDGNVEYLEVEGKKYPVETGEYYDDCTKVNILGTEYTIEKRTYEDDPKFKQEGIDGYCESYMRLIVYLDMVSDERYKDETQEAKVACEKETLRHEITHAFLNESGLRQCSHGMECGWSKDDEIVDWFAIQSPKIFKVFQELDIL